jgi:uncharacterized membrane protein (DUF485 family)
MSFFIFILVLLPLLFLLPTKKKNTQDDTKQTKVIKKAFTDFGKIVTLLVLGGGYLFVVALSSFATDSCGVTSSCIYLNMGLNVGIIYMILSFVLSAIYATFPQEKQLPIIFRPYIVIPLYIVIILIFATFD